LKQLLHSSHNLDHTGALQLNQYFIKEQPDRFLKKHVQKSHHAALQILLDLHRREPSDDNVLLECSSKSLKQIHDDIFICHNEFQKLKKKFEAKFFELVSLIRERKLKKMKQKFFRKFPDCYRYSDLIDNVGTVEGQRSLFYKEDGTFNYDEMDALSALILQFHRDFMDKEFANLKSRKEMLPETIISEALISQFLQLVKVHLKKKFDVREFKNHFPDKEFPKLDLTFKQLTISGIKKLLKLDKLSYEDFKHLCREVKVGEVLQLRDRVLISRTKMNNWVARKQKEEKSSRQSEAGSVASSRRSRYSRVNSDTHVDTQKISSSL